MNENTIRSALKIAGGALAGAFVARVALEASGVAWPWPVAVLLASSLAAAGGRLAARGRPRRRSPLPLFLLTVYVAWPRRDLGAAAAVALLAGLSALLGHVSARPFSRRRVWVLDALTFAAALAFYAATTVPDVLPADSGELQLVVPLLGVAHPPGYPLYTLAAHVFSWLWPALTPAFRANLFSAFLAAGTLALLAGAARRWARASGLPEAASALGGVATALALGGATTFWAQATVANIRMPTVFLLALCFDALSRFALCTRQQDGRGARRALLLTALWTVLALGHHPSLVFVAALFPPYLLLVDPGLLRQPRRWWRPAAAGLAGLLPLLYLPIRGAMGAPLAPPELATLQGFWHHFSAQGFGGDMFAFLTAADLPNRLALLPSIARMQFNAGLLLAAAAGALVLLRRDRRLLLLLAGGLAISAFVAVTYRAPQTVEYIMPAYLPLALLAGLAAAGLAALGRGLPIVAAAGILLAGSCNAASHAPSFFTLRGSSSARPVVEPILQAAPPGALLLADWHWAAPLWYLQQVEGQRPDVEVFYVYPEPARDYAEVWHERVQRAVDERPVVLTHYFDWAGYTLEPLGMGYRVHARPAAALPDQMPAVDVTFGDAVRLAGCRLSPTAPQAGQPLEVDLAWQATEGLGEAAPSLTVRLFDAQGNLVALADRSLSAGSAPGEVRYERLILALPTGLAPGPYQLQAGVYVHTGEGFSHWTDGRGEAFVTLAEVALRPRSERPFTLHPLDVPFAGGPRLVGVDYDRSIPGTLRVYLRWQAARRGAPATLVTLTAGAASATRLLPALPGGSMQSMVLELDAAAASGPLRLTLKGPPGPLAAAGAWGVRLDSVRLPRPAADARFVPLGDAMALTGVRVAGGRIVAGQPFALAIDLDFVALRPLVEDYAVSVRLTRADGTWLQMHDIQPGLGALPTLKWIRGTRIVDRHPFDAPDEPAGSALRATLVVHERFREWALPPADGPWSDVPLGEWVVEEGE